MLRSSSCGRCCVFFINITGVSIYRRFMMHYCFYYFAHTVCPDHLICIAGASTIFDSANISRLILCSRVDSFNNKRSEDTLSVLLNRYKIQLCLIYLFYGCKSFNAQVSFSSVWRFSMEQSDCFMDMYLWFKENDIHPPIHIT
jgi:hypothetical protein